MRKNIQKAKSRKRLWVHTLNWADEDKPLGYFDDSKSLNCGCVLCKIDTYMNRAKNKKARVIAKNEIASDIYEHYYGMMHLEMSEYFEWIY